MIPDSPRVMLAITDATPREFLADNLRADRYDPVLASGLQHATCRLADHIDAVIVDLGADTLFLIDRLRETTDTSVDPHIPVLALTGVEDRFHSIRLLDRGADAVLREPWSYIELRANLGALLRRVRSEPGHHRLTAGELTVDVDARRVWIGPVEINGLPAKEFELLRTLAAEPGRVFTRAELLETVWGLGDWARTRTLDAHAHRLRRRLTDGGGDGILTSVRGVGYAVRA